MLRFKRDKNDTAGMPFAITKDGDYKRAGLDDLEGALFEHICANRYRIASGKWEGWVIDNVHPAWIGDFGPSDYPAAVPDLIASAKPTSKYHRPCKGVEIDVYDVLGAFKVTNPAIAHAVKKCLAPGQRGAKSWAQDDMKVKLNWHNYKYFPYERLLAQDELKVLGASKIIRFDDKSVEIQYSGEIESLKRLVYFAEFELGVEKHLTNQAIIESLEDFSTKRKRQSTRYLVHGLHEYKGKFNPQIVRGIANKLGATNGCTILDPFCGSGTTLVESIISGSNGIGMDVNPFAAYISQAKIEGVFLESSVLYEEFNDLIEFVEKKRSIQSVESPRSEYLRNWLPEESYVIFENYRNRCLQKDYRSKNFLLALASDLIRDYSNQEPSDLRIRKRYTEFPTKSLKMALREKFESIFYKISRYHDMFGIPTAKWDIINKDSSVLSSFSNLKAWDYAISSPPYAMALPYVDTHRISMVWLGLISPSEISSTEKKLVGAREMNKAELDSRIVELLHNSANLPNSVAKVCKKYQNELSDTDGFRKREFPALLYRYFVQMRNVLHNLHESANGRNVKLAFVVGCNTSTIGGERTVINTPNLLYDIGAQAGWNSVENCELQTYSRYDLHSKNSINQERLLIWSN